MNKFFSIITFLLFITPVKVLAETVDTLFITDIPAPETVRVVETVVETLEVATGVTGQVAQPRMGVYKVQLGAFKIKGNADRFYETLQSTYGKSFYIENIPPYWKVRTGTYNSFRKALPVRKKFIDKGYKDAWISHPGQ